MTTLHVYPHSSDTLEVTFASGTTMFYPGEGYIASAIADDGRFLGEAEGATKDEAVRKLQQALVAQLAEVADAKMVRAARERIALSRMHSRDHAVKIADLSDGEFGHMVRQAMQEKVVEAATASRDAALADKALVKKAEHEALVDEQEARKHMTPLAGFTAHKVHVPDLDLREVDVHSIADARTLDVYSVLNILSGGEPLDRETTTYAQIAVIHALAAAHAIVEPDQVTAVLTPEQSAKVQAAVEVLGIDEATATAKVLAL